MSDTPQKTSSSSITRRKLLSMAGAGAAVSLAGCAGGSGGSSVPDDVDPIYLGEAHTEHGVRVTISNYVTADQFIDYSSDDVVAFDDDEFEQPPTSGGQFIFIGVVVDNVSDSNRAFPSDDEFLLEYNEDQLEQFTPRDRFFTTNNEDEYVSYTATVDEQDARRQGTFPGVNIEGWLIFEVPEGFNPSSLVLLCTFGGQDRDEFVQPWNMTER